MASQGLSRMINGMTIDRRTFLKYVGAGAVLASLGPLRGLSQTPITIGIAEPITGPASFFGLSGVRSAQLAVEEINAAGGVNVAGTPRPFAIQVEDSQGRPDQAVIAVQRLAGSSDFLMGLFSSEETLAILPQLVGFKRAGNPKIFLSTGAATPLTTLQVSQDYENLKYYFRVGPFNSLFVAQEMIDFARDFMNGTLGWTSVVVLAEDAKWNEPIREGLPPFLPPFADVLAEQAAIEVKATLVYALDTTDFSGIFAEATATGADSFFTLMSFTGIAPTIQWKQAQVPLPLLGVHIQAQQAAFDQLTGGAAESVATLTTATRAFITEKTIPYYDNFRAANPDLPIPAYTGPITYDAVYVLKEAIERAGTLDPDAMVQALEATRYVGTLGLIEFYLLSDLPRIPFTHDVVYINRETGRKNVQGIWIQWQGGEQKVIYPFEYTVGAPGAGFTCPPWYPQCV